MRILKLLRTKEYKQYPLNYILMVLTSDEGWTMNSLIWRTSEVGWFLLEVPLSLMGEGKGRFRVNYIFLHNSDNW